MDTDALRAALAELDRAWEESRAAVAQAQAELTQRTEDAHRLMAARDALRQILGEKPAQAEVETTTRGEQSVARLLGSGIGRTAVRGLRRNELVPGRAHALASAATQDVKVTFGESGGSRDLESREQQPDEAVAAPTGDTARVTATTHDVTASAQDDAVVLGRPERTVEGIRLLLQEQAERDVPLSTLRTEFRDRGWYDPEAKAPEALVYAAAKRAEAEFTNIVRTGRRSWRWSAKPDEVPQWPPPRIEIKGPFVADVAVEGPFTSGASPEGAATQDPPATPAGTE